jgi:hypothetical protein
MSPDYGTDHTLIADLATANPSEFEGMLRSTDGGTTWQPINTGLPGLVIRNFRYSKDYSHDHKLWVLSMMRFNYQILTHPDGWFPAITVKPGNPPIPAQFPSLQR